MDSSRIGFGNIGIDSWYRILCDEMKTKWRTMMMGLPQWLKQDEGELAMAHDDITVPQMAKIEPRIGVRGGYNPPAGVSKPPVPTTGSGVQQTVHPHAEATHPVFDDSDAIARAVAITENFKKQKREQDEQIDKLNKSNDAMRRKLVDTELALIAANARADQSDAKAEELRQETADMRALFSTIRTVVEGFTTPTLPVRKPKQSKPREETVPAK